MARYTLQEAEEFYYAAKSAYLNALSNKSYDVNNRSKENQKIESLKKDMDYWAKIKNDLAKGRGTGRIVKRGIPRA